MMEQVRIAILNAANIPVAYLDNSHRKSLHYWDDELHEYLQGTANTYKFTVSAKHADSSSVKAGNKVAFIAHGKSYYLNIVNTEQDEQTITAEAWSLSFELINEDAGEYKSADAMSFEEYLAVFDAEHSLKMGLNEVSDKRISNEWTGTTSVLKRLFSLANVFSAEIEFEVVLNKDYSLKEIVLNAYKQQNEKNSGVGEIRNDVVLRYGKGITGIRKTTDISSLYTCILPLGKDGLTINGLDKKEYDDNGNIEYFTDSALIRAPQARERFPSNIANKRDAYIMMRKEYDTDDKEKLYNMALSDLKIASEPVISYEADGYFDTNIGDTVEMQDQEWTPVLYLQARVSEQVRSFTNPTVAKTVFTNYKELMSEISDDLLEKMQDLINKTKVYTCSIATNNGTIFKNGVGSTTLTAYAYNNGVDVSSSLEIRWSKDGQEFYVGRSVTVNAEDVESKALYSFVAFEQGIRRGYYEVTITNVMDGEDGKDGQDGIPGTTYYTWIKYADDEYGNGMSESPDGKQYMGIAYNKETSAESNNPEDYQWARITGEGIPGKPGADGKTYYTWVKYADDQNGNGMSDSPAGKYYIGFAFNKESQTESNNPRDYQWSKYRGEDGIPGADGADGKTTYFHVKYSSVPNPTSSSQMTETPSKYIGTYVDFVMQDSTNPRDYTWSQFQGDPGENGIPGTNGQDGRTSYLHIAYANSSDGYADFSTTNSTGKKYMGQYVDYTEKDSENPYMYKWSKIKGEDGQDGTDGQDGQDGVGIDKIEKYYLASEINTGITTSTYGWTTTMQSMTETKKYLWSYDKIYYSNKKTTDTTPVIIGVHGQNGADGENGIIVSPTAPEKPKVGQLWQTASGEPIKRWDGSRWVLHYVSVENLDVQTLSSITANLGTIIAGVIKNNSLENPLVFDVENGFLEVKNDTGWLARLATGILLLEGKDSGTYRQRLSVTNGGLSYRQPDMNSGSDLIFRDKDVVIAPTGENEVPIVESLKKVLSIKEYDSGQVRGPYANVNSSNRTHVWLYKIGKIVHCKIEMLAQFPNRGSFNDFNEVIIPAEFRPKYHVFCACPEVVAGTIVGNGRYRIGDKISLDVENASYAERTICTSWIAAS